MAKKFGKFLFVTAAVAAAAGAYYYYFQEKERLNKFMEEDDEDFDDFHTDLEDDEALGALELDESFEEEDDTADDMAEAVEDAFRHDKLIVACSTYDGGLFPCMEDFLSHLKAKNFQKRKVGLVENGSWAPMAAKYMKAAFEGMKSIELCDTVVTIKSSLKDDSRQALEALAEQFV